MPRRRLFLSALPAATALLAACQTTPATEVAQRRVVFFTEDSAALNENGLAIVANAAEFAKANPALPVAVLGYAGPVGSAQFNRALSEARARHVADHLVEFGVERRRIAIRPRGPVPFDMIPTESRRVEIAVGG
jgi:outer membrane protein OmpA-like peptidoglycan-associated protein